jgi:hypothetical protein
MEHRIGFEPMNTEFRKILDHRGVVANDSTGALARLQIARAYALSGDSAKARAAYEDFLNLCKYSAEGLQIRILAKTEHARL